MREKGRDLIALKLERHAEKIYDIFISHTDAASNLGDEEELEGQTEDDIPKVRVTKANKLMKDLAYIVGLSFSTFDDYAEGVNDEKKTAKPLIEKMQ